MTSAASPSIQTGAGDHRRDDTLSLVPGEMRHFARAMTDGATLAKDLVAAGGIDQRGAGDVEHALQSRQILINRGILAELLSRFPELDA